MAKKTRKTKSFIRGTQIFSYNMAMFIQGAKRVGYWGLAVYVFIFLVLMFLLTSQTDINTMRMQIKSNTLNAVGYGDTVVIRDPRRNIEMTAQAVAESSIDQA